MSSVQPEKLPFFFYGTLRPGERNYDHLLKGQTSHEENGWWLEGAELYLHAAGSYGHLKPAEMHYQPSGAYPYLVEGTGRVAGHLIELKPELYEALLVELDWLEGFSENAPAEENEYLRIEREIVHESGARRQAWIYLGAPHAFSRQAPYLTRIESGDWLEWRKSQTKTNEAI